MRRNLAIALLFMYAFSSTELHQAMRLPLLVEHYREHSANVDLTFWEFLVMHYETDVAHDETDNRLPFKDCGHSVSVSQVALPASFTLETRPEVTRLDHQSHYLTQIPPLHAAKIFQPPKV
ncbi:MAG: hypothetical protein ACOYW3_01275 [Bacteroidota bacterium]